MDQNSFYRLLEKVNVLNYDNGKRFTRTDRLDVIAKLLWDSSYRRINPDGLFHLYAKAPLSELPGELVVVSSHVDCHRAISNCFTDWPDQNLWVGTFDNALTNAAVLSLMLENMLPEDTVLAFTGDEEEDSKGAKQVVRYFRERNHRRIKVIVTDVTDMGWHEACDFTLENNFWTDETGRTAVSAALACGRCWRFVPSDPQMLPCYVPEEQVIALEAEPDESWEYDEEGVECFSLCIPVKGAMHSNTGVQVRRQALHAYTDVLQQLCRKLGTGSFR